MFGNKPTVISTDHQRELISKHLRYADELVRAKNFNGALEEIRKALLLDPKHSLARSFQQRIMLIQKQNAPHEDLAPKGPTQEEIMQMITQHFSAAEQMITRREYPEALKKIAEVYAVDPGNHFAKAYSDRIEQLMMEQEQEGQKIFSSAIQQSKVEPQAKVAESPLHLERGSLLMYEEMMKEAWFDGKVTPEEEQELRSVREIFHITMEEHMLIEKKVKIEAYVDALRLAWKDGVISEMERQVLDMMRRRYGITPEEHLTIENVVQDAKKGTQPKARILLVEPDKTVLVTVMRALQQHHYEVVIASRAEDALQVMVKQLPKLIISEAIFPTGSLDGFGFYTKVQEHPSLKDTPFFFITETNNQKILRAALRMGFDLCLTKPIDLDLLIAAVEGRLSAK
ncbi:MAG: response regulator [Bacteroidota bacterium]|jgi:CheY-like chemotaxis protein